MLNIKTQVLLNSNFLIILILKKLVSKHNKFAVQEGDNQAGLVSSYMLFL